MLIPIRIAFFISISFCISTAMFSQKTVSGIVMDSNNQPIEGVVVSVKSSNLNAITDSAGFYIINVNTDSQILIFSKNNFIENKMAIDTTIINCKMTRYDQMDLSELSLEDLMGIPITISNYKPSSIREQSGIITVFTSKDIETMGAITLQDVLIRIPGVSLGMDNHNAVSLMMRGNWTLEGKVLYIVNDIPVNDLIFGTYPIPPNFSADMLEKVEVLRGPGSAKYGGNGQLAVIRIYTKTKKKDAQVSVSGMSQSANANTGIISYNDRYQLGKVAITVAGSANKGKWGKGTWQDANGDTVDVSKINTHGQNLSFKADRKGFHYNFYFDNYEMDGIQNFGIVSPNENVRFLQVSQSISQDIAIGEKWKLLPKLAYRTESTWKSKSYYPTGNGYYDIRAESGNASIEATNHFSDHLNFTVGLMNELQKGHVIKTIYNGYDYTALLSKPDGIVFYNLTALYGAMNLKLGKFDLSLGVRAIYHTYAKGAVTPRIGITRVEKKWHMKLLYGNAFREPNIEQIDNNVSNFPDIPPLKAELTDVLEYEFGHKIGRYSYLTSSVFFQYMRNPIIYTPQGFTNNRPSETGGVELQYVYQRPRLTLQANYCYTYANDDEIPLYDVQGHSGQNVGAAAHIGNIWGSWKTGIPHLTLLVSGRYLGERYANTYNENLVGGNSLPISQKSLAPEIIFNVGLGYDISAFNISLYLNNISNQTQYIPQPYNDASTPFPYAARELRLKLKWNIPYKDSQN